MSVYTDKIKMVLTIAFDDEANNNDDGWLKRTMCHECALADATGSHCCDRARD